MFVICVWIMRYIWLYFQSIFTLKHIQLSNYNKITCIHICIWFLLYIYHFTDLCANILMSYFPPFLLLVISLSIAVNHFMWKNLWMRRLVSWRSFPGYVIKGCKKDEMFILWENPGGSLPINSKRLFFTFVRKMWRFFWVWPRLPNLQTNSLATVWTIIVLSLSGWYWLNLI